MALSGGRPRRRVPPLVIAACLKFVDRRPEVDRLSGEVHTDIRSSGMSDADAAALEWALRLAEQWNEEVVALSVGPADANAVLEEALACGATKAIRVDIPQSVASSTVAAALAAVCEDARLFLCGDWSLDRGSGSVPAYLAGLAGASQALGLVSLESVEPGLVRAERRLDGGRRERLLVRTPAVISVEGASARLRRASLAAALAAKRSAIDVQQPALAATVVQVPSRSGPFRPRPRVLPPPPSDLSPRERVLALTGALQERTPPKRVVMEPEEAADFLLEQLREWGELPEAE